MAEHTTSRLLAGPLRRPGPVAHGGRLLAGPLRRPGPAPFGALRRRLLDGPQRRDMLDGGTGRVAGVVTVAGVPASRRVRLLDRRGGRLLRETWSDPVSGAYAFDYLALRIYTVLAHDHHGEYNAVVADGVSPEPMP